MVPQGSELATYLKQTGLDESDLILVESDGRMDMNYRLAPTGVMVVRNELGTGPRLIRPANSHEAAERSLEWWTRKGEMIRSAFAGLKGAIVDPRRSAFVWPDRDLGPSSGDALTDLRMLREQYQIVKKMIAEKELMLELEPEEIRKRRAVEAREEARRRANDRFQETAARARGITLESETED